MQIALELVDDDAVTSRGEHVVGGAGARAIRARLVAAVRTSQGSDLGPEPERMQREVRCQPPACFDAAHAVSLGVERRREHTDAELPGQHCDDAPGHAALGRQSDAIRPLARVVVHPARTHHAQHVLDAFVLERALSGERIHAVIRQRRRHDREHAAVDEQRALPEVEVDGLVDVAVDHAEAAHQVRERAVAVSRGALGFVDALVERELPPGERGKARPQHGLACLEVFSFDQSGRDDRTRVHHRVERAVRRVDRDRVERVPRRLDAHSLHHELAAVLRERHPEDERLRDRLDGERFAAVTDLEEVSVGRDDRDAERAGVGGGELGDVARHLAVTDLGELVAEITEIAQNRRFDLGARHGVSTPRLPDTGVARWSRCRYASLTKT